MARSLDIPARVAVGFTPGEHEAGDTYRVTSHDAHAWPEIYLAGMGWTHLFDPTPGNQATGGSNLPKDDAAPDTDAAHRPAAHRHHAGHREHDAGRHRQPVVARHHSGHAHAGAGHRELVVEHRRLAPRARGARAPGPPRRRLRRRGARAEAAPTRATSCCR